MRERVFRKIAALSATYPLRILFLAGILTMLAAMAAEHLTLSMHFKNLMPAHHPMVREFDSIMNDYSTSSMIIVAATGPEKELKAFVERVGPKIAAMDEYIQQVEYKMETDFFKNHGFMVQKVKDLKKSRKLLTQYELIPWLTALNENFEETWVADEESISTVEKENNAIMMLNNVETVLRTLARYWKGQTKDPHPAEKAAEQFLIGDPYYISQDKDMILLFARPTFTIDDIGKVIVAENKIDSLLKAEAEHFPGLDVGTTGTMALSRDETEAANADMYWTTVIAMVLIVGLFIVSFRMWVSPLLAGIVLMVGIMWTAGFTAWTVGTLNIMTSMFSVVLIGLGVDFSIHIIALYTERRAEGESIEQALTNTLIKSGGGVLTGAMTTAFAFLTLMISDTAGMSEFGLVAGSGVIFCVLSTFMVLPPLLVLRDNVLMRLRGEKYRVRSTAFPLLGTSSRWIIAHRKLTAVLLTLVSLFLMWQANRIRFDYNYLNMEPVGLKSIQLQHLMEEKFHITPDFAVVTVKSPEESYYMAQKAKKLKMIGMVSTISDYIPPLKKQQEKQPILTDILLKSEKAKVGSRFSKDFSSKLLTELQRLNDNIIELSQLAYLGGQDRVDHQCRKLVGDPEADERGYMDSMMTMIRNRPLPAHRIAAFSVPFFKTMKKMVLRMANPEIITVENLPASIKDKFLSKSGKKYLVSIYPKESVWNLAFLERFTQHMKKLSPRVTGIPLIFYVLIDILGSDGTRAALVALIIIFLLLLLDFKSVKYALMAMVPLLLGGVWMLGLMNTLGLKLTMVNVMGLPLILGIGVDDGVHILHRFNVEKKLPLPHLFVSTGRAILITSLTTMLAFGSFKFATYRGLGSLGAALFIGVGACFLATVIFLPMMLSYMSNKKEGKADEK